MTVDFDSKCSYLNENDTYHPKLIKYCLKIIPYVECYKQQIAYYNQTAYNILANEINLILPKFPVEKRQKRGAIRASMLGGIASSLIGLAYEEISSFLHDKRPKALKKAIYAIDKKMDIQHNKIYHLEDPMIMYGVYNSDTLTDLIDTVNRMHNTTPGKKEPLQEG